MNSWRTNAHSSHLEWGKILKRLSYLLIIVLLAFPQMGQATGLPVKEYFVNGRFFIIFQNHF
jgi:hypothetical protein